ncbi:MAG: hypothetical protein C0625_09105 [Arcobacter sp.]|nr:MAG: hypothetical protein C0625_09105 [Arcobacter sp.]
MTFFDNKIFIKIFKLMFTSILFFSIIFTIYSISNQKEQILKSLNLEASGIAKMLTYISSDAIVLDDGAFLIEFNSEFIRENKSLENIILAKLDGTNYLIKKDSWSYEENLDESLFKKQKNEINSEIIFSPIMKKEIFHYVYPIIFSGTNWGWIHLSLSLDDYNKKLKSMYTEYITFFSSLLLITFFISYLIAKSLSDPIIKLNRVANQISRGYLDLRSDYKSDDELGELSKTFNTMITKIQESQDALKASHEKLEDRVKDRTLELYETNQELEDKSRQLEELNKNLDVKVKEEVKKRLKNEGLLIQQSRLAAMGEMLGNIAHQWRQPLSVITTAASGMKLEKELGLDSIESENERFNLIIKTANFLSNTIEDFSNFFKPNKNKEYFYIQDRVEQSLGLVGASLNFHYINIEKDYSCEEKVYGFPNEFAQAVLNILNNAKDILVQKNIENPTIKIRVFKKNAYGYLEIEDNGGGIEEKIMDKIFDPYFTTKHQSQGTGIGLYMSKIIIEQNMEGKLEVRNCKNGVIFSVAIHII